MKISKALRYLIFEMGRAPSEFDKQFTAFSDQIEKTIFLLAFCTDRQAENHWAKELNGVLRGLFTKNKKGNNNRKNYSYEEVRAKLIFIFEPLDTLLTDLKTLHEFDDYPISDTLDSKKIISLCELLAKRITDPSPVFIKQDDVQKALAK